jgi:hypothetical protein
MTHGSESVGHGCSGLSGKKLYYSSEEILYQLLDFTEHIIQEGRKN